MSLPKLDSAVTVISKTFPKQEIEQILNTPGIYFTGEHYLYPVSIEGRTGNHLDSLFIIEPIAANDKFVEWICNDICRWIEKEQIKCDVIFAPAQPAVKKIVHQLASQIGAREAYWEYFPTGWFGSKLVEGEIRSNDNVLVLNGVSQQGRCVGERLPNFVESLGGKTVAAAVFAIGTAPGAKQAQELYKNKLYASVMVDINIQPSQSCTVCAGKDIAIPWTQFRK